MRKPQQNVEILFTNAEVVGKGFEHICQVSRDGKNVVKSTRPVVGFWQHEDPEKKANDVRQLESTIDELEFQDDIKVIPTQVKGPTKIVNEEGTKVVSSAVIAPFIPEFNSKMLSYEALKSDPELRAIAVKLVQLTDRLYNDPLNPRGLDLYGGEIMIDSIKASVYQLIDMLTFFTKKFSPGVEGKMRNILHSRDGIKTSSGNEVCAPNQVMITDPGMHNLSKDSAWHIRFTLNQMDLLMAGTLVVLLKDLDPSIPDEDLPYSGNWFQMTLAKLMYRGIIKPQFERYEELKARKAKDALEDKLEKLETVFRKNEVSLALEEKTANPENVTTPELQKAADLSIAINNLIARVFPQLSEHQLRVGNLAYKIAKEMGLNDLEAERVMIAGRIHDVGKLFVDPELKIPDKKYQAEERKAMQAHVDDSVEFAEKMGVFDASIIRSVGEHHESLQGDSYPYGKSDGQISLSGQILKLADIFDAMTDSSRKYKNALTIDQAVAELKKLRGNQIRSDIVDAFFKIAKGADSILSTPKNKEISA